MVVLCERVDKRMVEYLFSMKEESVKEHLNVSKDKPFKSEYSKLKNFLRSHLDGVGETREYRHSNGKNFGRLFSNGVQGLQKKWRGALCKHMTDIDLVNCHPNILLYVCKQHDIACPMLEKYVDSRDDILQEFVNETQIAHNQAKEYFLKATNDCRKSNIQFNFFNAYDTEMKRIQKKLMTVDKYAFIHVHTDEKEYNRQGSFINNVMCYYENLILQDSMEFLQDKGYEVATLMFDGLMIYGNQYGNTELLDEMTNFIYSKWNFNFKYSYKPHDTSIQIPDAFEEGKVLLSYTNMCTEFNKTHVKVGEMYVCTSNGNHVLTESSLAKKYRHIRVHDCKRPFINHWLDNDDQTMKVYERFGIYPQLDAPQDVFNLWEPFRCEAYTDEYNKNPTGLQQILKLIDCLANHEECVYDFILDWLAQMIQYPVTKSVVPVLIGDMGIGKNTLIDIIKSMLGASKVWDSTNPMRDIWGQFNDRMRDTFLINLNEVGFKDFAPALGMVKAMITDNTFTLHEKGKGAQELPSFHRFIVCTNSEMPLPTSENERRFVIIRCSDELMYEYKFFEDLRAIMSNIDTLRTFYDYLKVRPCREKFRKQDLPVTAYHKELKMAGRDHLSLWLEDLAMKTPEATVTLTSQQCWDSFRMFCTESNIPVNINSHIFHTKLGVKKIPGIGGTVVNKKGGKCIRARQIELTVLRTHFGIPDFL